MGLPGSGKTTLAGELCTLLLGAGKTVAWFNADQVREQFNDWDFSETGRIRQGRRMRELADECGCDYAICDFVAPLPKMREAFAADYVVWLDTIVEGRFADTNKAFIAPAEYSIKVNTQDAAHWAAIVAEQIR